jgi:hypothetical protein
MLIGPGHVALHGAFANVQALAGDLLITAAVQLAPQKSGGTNTGKPSSIIQGL